MVRKIEVVALILFLGLASAVFADQITLKNGDRLTGTVVKSDGKVLVLHTEFAGDVTLQFAAITQITTEKALHVALKNGQTVVGPITTSDGNLEVAGKNGTPVEAPKDTVVAIRNDADELAALTAQDLGARADLIDVDCSGGAGAQCRLVQDAAEIAAGILIADDQDRAVWRV